MEYIVTFEVETKEFNKDGTKFNLNVDYENLEKIKEDIKKEDKFIIFQNKMSDGTFNETIIKQEIVRRVTIKQILKNL